MRSPRRSARSTPTPTRSSGRPSLPTSRPTWPCRWPSGSRRPPAAFGPESAAPAPLIRPPQFPASQANVALPLAKRLGRPPREVATELAGHLDLTSVAGPPEVRGPGFINITLHSDWIAAQAGTQLSDPRLGVPVASPALKVVVDYSAPNVAKEMHVGHLRTTVVGDAIVR